MHESAPAVRIYRTVSSWFMRLARTEYLGVLYVHTPTVCKRAAFQVENVPIANGAIVYDVSFHSQSLAPAFASLSPQRETAAPPTARISNGSLEATVAA